MPSHELTELFVHEMNRRFATGVRGKDFYGYDYTVGRKFDKIIKVMTQKHEDGVYRETPAGCHAFMAPETGDLFFAASWNSPQRSKDGTLKPRRRMPDEEAVRRTVHNIQDPIGYIYVGGK